MTLTRRQSIDVCREGPALFSGLPGNEVDIERLSDFVSGRGIDAAIHVIDGTLEGILWIKDGVPGDAWFLEADGGETIVPIEPEGELLRDIAASGTVSCYVCSVDTAQEAAAPPRGHRDRPPAAASSSTPTVTRRPDSGQESLPALLRGSPSRSADDRRKPEQAASATPAASVSRTTDTTVAVGSDAGRAPTPAVRRQPAPTDDPDAQNSPSPVGSERAPVESATAAVHDTVPPPAAPSSKPWPAILIEIRARVAKQRGKRLAERFTEALGDALEFHGGRVDQDRVIAPPLSDEQWAAVIEVVCAPVVAVAGRAWTNRILEAAERTVLTREGLE